MPIPAANNLRDDLYRCWLLTIVQEYVKIRDSHPELNRLQIPNFAVAESYSRKLGTWDAVNRQIAFAAPLLDQGDWTLIVLVLQHEMAHQIVSELFNLRDAVPHGEAFKRACDLLGIPATACYDERSIGVNRASPTIRRIQKLIALGESSNKHEAEQALMKAHKLMLKYNVDLQNSRTELHYAFCVLAPLFRRVPSYIWSIMHILEQFYFVKYICRPCSADLMTHVAGDNQRPGRVRIIELYGMPENLQSADYVYNFLLHEGQRQWQLYQKKCGLKTRKLRLSFLKGVYSSFFDKLRREQRDIAKVDAALIWKGDPKLDAFYRKRNPRVRREVRQSAHHETAHAAGQKIGRQLNVRLGVRETSKHQNQIKPVLRLS